MKSQISVEGVWFRYPGSDEYALRDVNTTIESGEFVGLIGQNGSGKSTLANLIVGLYKPEKGRILVDGVDIKSLNLDDVAKKIGFVFQNPDYQLFTRKVWDEVAFGPRNFGFKEDVIQKSVDHILRKVRLIKYSTIHPQALSRGERRRLATATVLVSKPKILLFDEPTTGQDYGHSRHTVDLINNLNKQGLTIIMVTHDVKLVAEYTDKVLLMDNGQLIANRPTKELLSDQELLNRVGIYAPVATRLSLALREKFPDFPVELTVENFVSNFKSLVSSKMEEDM